MVQGLVFRYMVPYIRILLSMVCPQSTFCTEHTCIHLYKLGEAIKIRDGIMLDMVICDA